MKRLFTFLTFLLAALAALPLAAQIPGGSPPDCNEFNLLNSIWVGQTAGQSFSDITVLGKITDASGAQRDFLCVSQPIAAGGTPAVLVPGSLIVTNPSGGLPVIEIVSSSTTNRKMRINFGDINIVGGHETDGYIIMDQAGVENEDLGFWGGNNIPYLYFTLNCIAGCSNSFVSSTGTKQFLVATNGNAATVNPDFGLVSGHIAHTTGAGGTDGWGTLTCSSSSATYTFQVAQSTATYKVILTDQTTTGGAKVSSRATGSFTIACSGASDSVDYLVLGNPY